MEIRKFRKIYELDLIPASHEGILIGDLVWDPLIGRPDFARSGMPNTIYNAFLDAGLIDREGWELFRKECEETEFQDARLASRNIEVHTELISELDHPELGKLKGAFKLDHISKFMFGALQVREMDDLLRVKIDQYLEMLKSGHWNEYDGKIRRVNMITELYYGSIKLVVDKKFSPELDAALNHTNMKLSTRVEGSWAVEYEFSHDRIPFAMRTERIRDFNG